MSTQKTYWHLEPNRKKPTEYEIGSSRLLYSVDRGFEVKTPIEAWYARHQKGSPLASKDWDAFRDPRETTYAIYCEHQKTKESFVDGLLRSIDGTDYDLKLSPTWIEALDRILPTLRFPIHGLQMIAAYVGQMAPSGRIAIACLFQAGDEIRRIQRIAQRMRQLQSTHAEFGANSKAVWQSDPAWQPLRRVIERLFVTFDWGEAFAALNLVLKPAFDALFIARFAAEAEKAHDHVLGKVLFSLQEDSMWHREWAGALVDHAVGTNPENQQVLAGWTERWQPQVLAALEPLEPLFTEGTGDAR
jgi:toluene monooxygenase system protein E